MPHGIKEGRTFRIGFDNDLPIDPALNPGVFSGGPTCGTLVTGLRLRPDLAEAEPTVSKDGRKYTFTIRKDARFSDGKAVTARAFSRALERIRDPALQSGIALDFQDVRDVVANGRTLTFRLTRPQPALPAFTTGLCPRTSRSTRRGRTRRCRAQDRTTPRSM